jgi:alanine racemase
MEWGPAIRPTRAEIDLGAIVSNSRVLCRQAGSPLLAVVKADAYGHGAYQVAAALEAANTIDGFAVSLVEEGIELRLSGITKEILVMGPSLIDSYHSIVEHELTPMVSDERHIAPLAAAALGQGKTLAIHLKVDTGMHRLGLAPDRLSTLVSSLLKTEGVRITGVASHLACADIDDPKDPKSVTAKQLSRFERVVALCRASLGESTRYHLANSAAILRFPAASYDLARPGIALYGNGGGEFVGLHQALSLRSSVTQLRQVQAGESVSYGARWTADRATTAALVPVGYADGLPRNLSGKGCALISGRRCPIIGTVSMDMIVVDVTDLPSTVLGAEVVLIGKQGQAEIATAEIAEHCNISEYEVSCGISKRVPRIYVGDEELGSHV